MSLRSRSARPTLAPSASCPALGPTASRQSVSHRSPSGSAPTPSRGKARPKRSKAGRRPVEGVCANCGCNEQETGQWREDRSGLFGVGTHKLCSACGLYFNNNKQHRPPGLWARGRRPTPSVIARESRRLSGGSGSSFSSGSSYSPAKVPTSTSASPQIYSFSSSSPPPGYYSAGSIPVNRKLRLTVGRETKLCLPSSGLADEELTIVLGTAVGRRREAVVVEETGVQRRSFEGSAVEALLSLSECKEIQPLPAIPVQLCFTVLPSAPSQLPPARLASELHVQSPSPRGFSASPLLPWPVHSLARAYPQPSERFDLPPMRDVARPSRQLPSLRALGLAGVSVK